MIEQTRIVRSAALVYAAALGLQAAVAAAVSTDPGGAAMNARFAALGALLFLGPALAAARPTKTHLSPIARFSLWSLVAWSTLAFIGIAPVWRSAQAPGWIILTAGAAAFFCLIGLVSGHRRDALRPGAGALLGAALLVSFYSASSLWGTGFISPSIFEKARAGSVHVDTYFVSAVAAFLRDHGKVTLGLEGMPHLSKHFLSQCIFAGVSKITGAPTLQVYASFYAEVVPCSLVLSAVLLAFRLGGGGITFLTLAVTTLLTLFLPGAWLNAFATWEPLGSESYGVSLMLMFQALTTLPLTSGPSEKEQSLCDAVLHGAWLTALTLCKISVGFLWGVCASAVAVVFAKGKPGLRAATPLVTACAFALCWPHIVEPMDTKIQPLYFVRTYSYGSWKLFPIFMFIHWLPLWAGMPFFAARMRRAGDGLPRSILNDRYLFAVLLPACAVGFASLSLSIFAGSGIYFSSLPAVLAVPWTAALAFDAFRPEAGRRAKIYACACLCVAILCQWLPRIPATWSHVIRNQVSVQATPEARAELSALVDMRARLQAVPRCGLHVAAEMLIDSAIARDYHCWKIPYFYTGILERPLYQTWMRPECRGTRFGVEYRHPQGTDPGPSAHTPASLCARARRDGLSCIEELSRSGVTKIDCPADSLGTNAHN